MVLAIRAERGTSYRQSVEYIWVTGNKSGTLSAHNAAQTQLPVGPSLGSHPSPRRRTRLQIAAPCFFGVNRDPH